MTTPDDQRAALLLSNRLSRVETSPLKAREFWALVDRADAADIALGQLLHDSELCAAVAVDDVTAERLQTLLAAVRSFAFEVERLGEAGVHLISALDPRFPSMLRDRMEHGCPPHLFAAGDVDALVRPALSIVGDMTQRPLDDLARRAAAAAVVAGWSVAMPDSTAPGDLAATTLDEATACAGSVVVVAASGINHAARQPALRKLVQTNAISLVSPFAPHAAASAATTRARDSMLHSIGTLTLVVACADGTGSAWAAASDAIGREPASVVTVVDGNAAAGNRALAELGAQRLDSVDDLSALLV